MVVRLFILYYEIGIIDYNIAYNAKEIKRQELISLLKRRAILSASLQYLEDYFMQYSKDEESKKTLTFPEKKIVITPDILPNMLYHCTKYTGNVKELSIYDFSKPKNGKYLTRDGMVYAGDLDTVKRYVRCGNEQIIEHVLDKSDMTQYFGIYESHGGVPFMFQEELYAMSKEGTVKWLIQSPEMHSVEAIYIGNFADFVDWRDGMMRKCLERNGNLRLPLPNGKESYDEYIRYLEQELYENQDTVRRFGEQDMSEER